MKDCLGGLVRTIWKPLKGYIDETHHIMLVSILNENLDKGNNQVHKLNDIIREFFKEKEFKPIVVR